VARVFLLPEPGDIVWCRFPHQGFTAPGPKPRPALVIDAGRLGESPAVEVIFGTSKRLDRIFPGEFAITPADGDAFALSGLSFATKFNTARTMFLPYDDSWFDVAPGAPYGQTPKLGVLHPALLRRVEAAVRATKR
jgi:hypothetical protein